MEGQKVSVEELKILLEFYKIAANGSKKPLNRGKQRNDESDEPASSSNSVRDALEHKPMLRAIERIVLSNFNEQPKHN